MRFMSLLALALVLAACGKEKAAQNGGNQGAQLAKTDGTGDGASTTTVPATTAEAAKAGNGLLEYCKWNPNDKKGGCMACIPREIEVLKCAKDVKEDFDPAKDCNGEAEKKLLTCEMGGNDEFVFDMSQPSKSEAIFEKMPLLLAGAKFLIADKVKDDKKKDLLLGAIDIFQNRAKSILNNEDVSPAAEDIAALAKTAKPGIKDAELAAIKAQMISSITAIQARRRSGDFADTDMMTLLIGFIGNLPPDIVGDSLKGIDLNTLASAVLGTGNTGDLMGVLGGFIPKGSGSSSTSGSTAGTGS
jgi:hypothetical protein